MRLIDADVFLDFVHRNCNDSLADLWCELICMQPTAYDVDKVVENIRNIPHGQILNMELEEVIVEIVKAAMKG